MDIRVKRAYDEPSDNDGERILVDRIWPRGVSKKDLRIEAWEKELAPSNELRKWFGHEPDRWEAFRERYFEELDGRREVVDALLDRVGDGRVTLVYGAKDEDHNNAVALRDYLKRRAD